MRWTAILALLVATVLVSAPPLQGRQETAAETPAQLRARLDSLRPLLEKAEGDLRAREARRAEIERRTAGDAVLVDTFEVGGATILTPVDRSDATRELFRSVWEEHFGRLGHSESLARSTMVFQWSDEKVPIHVEGEAEAVYLDRWTPPARVEQAVRDLFARAMYQDLRAGTRVGVWIEHNPLSRISLPDVYRRIATTRSRVSRQCLAGDVGACLSAMGLDVGDVSEQLGAWYTPEELRSLVASAYDPALRRAAADRARCVDEGALDVCEELLVRRRFMNWTPLGGEVRRSLVAYALEVGGPGAWTRLVEDPDMEPIRALEHASGLPVTSLVEGWRSRLLSQRPDAHGGLLPESARAALWTLFFAALAMRSTRWRLG